MSVKYVYVEVFLLICFVNGNPSTDCVGPALSPIDVIDYEIEETFKPLQSFNLVYKLQLEPIKSGSSLGFWPSKAHTQKELPFVAEGPLESGLKFRLARISFSSPSQHLLNGVAYPVEVDLTFYDEKFKDFQDATRFPGSYVNLALFFKIDKNSKEKLWKLNETGQELFVTAKSLMPKQILNYFVYNGSDTSSLNCPTDEEVQWILSQNVEKVGSGQVELLRQILNDREITNIQPQEANNTSRVKGSRWVEKNGDKKEKSPDNIDHFFLFIMSIIIFFMQCGFAFMEAGAVKSKNTVNILIKNWLDVCFGALIYWATGFAFTYGAKSNCFISYSYFFGVGMPAKKLSKWFFNFVFAATAATLVSGALAERCQFLAYVVYSMMITGFIYPVIAHWGWHPDGWLKTNGFHDFAGSGVVHLCGAVCALIGCVLMGPRIGRFDKKGNLIDMPGHSIPLSALGGFILIFGFLACNGAKQGSISNYKDGVTVITAIVNTVLGTSAAGISTLIVNKMGFVPGTVKTYSLLTTMNGSLTGTIALCAGCDVYSLWASVVVGLLSGPIYLFVRTVLLRFRVDDPLDAIPVHGGGGVWGLLAAHIFRKNGILETWSTKAVWGLLWNFIGLISIVVWTGVTCLFLFSILKRFKLLRVDMETEFKGMDLIKHGESAYPADAWVERQYTATPKVSRVHKRSELGPGLEEKEEFLSGGDLPPHMRATGGAIYNNAEEMFPSQARLFTSLRSTLSGAQSSMEKQKKEEEKDSLTAPEYQHRRRGSVRSEMWMKNIMAQPKFEKFKRSMSIKRGGRKNSQAESTDGEDQSELPTGQEEAYVQDCIQESNEDHAADSDNETLPQVMICLSDGDAATESSSAENATRSH